jgi:PTH1 family peptidyl-tRNA hydrolase
MVGVPTGDGQSRVYLIVGLGNPGRSYVHTRHNVGFDCVELLSRDVGIRLARKERQALVGEGEFGGKRLVLTQPQTFMNLSGLSVAALVRKYRVPLAQILVVYDEMDLSLGTIRIRERGSAAGHHGMESIIAALHSQDFPRLRIGIGPAGGREVGAEHVLSRFTSSERVIAQDALARAVAAIEMLLTDGIAAAMDRFNRRAEPDSQ